jgi:hypothetical protein
MVTKMDSVANRFDCHRWMVNKMGLTPPLDLVAAIKWTLKSGEYDKPPFVCFDHPQRMGNF